MPHEPLSQSDYEALFEFDSPWGYDGQEDFNAIDDFGGAPYYGMPVGGQFNDPAPTGIEGLTGQATPRTGYVSVNDNPEIFTPLGQGGQTGGQTNMAEIDWNAEWGNASELGGWGGTLAAAAALGGSGTAPATGGTGSAPSTGGGTNLWDIGALLLTGYQSYAAGEAAKDAGQLQYQSTQDASKVQREMFDIGKEGLDPYSEAGVPAINRESAILGLRGDEEQRIARDQLYSGPGFEYKRDRIIGDINRGASASGQLKSGNRLAALTDRLKGLYASTENEYISQLSNLGRTGLSGASAIAGVSQNAGPQIGANTIAGGTNLANAKLGQSESYQSGVADIYGAVRDRWGR